MSISISSLNPRYATGLSGERFGQLIAKLRRFPAHLQGRLIVEGIFWAVDSDNFDISEATPTPGFPEMFEFLTVSRNPGIAIAVGVRRRFPLRGVRWTVFAGVERIDNDTAGCYLVRPFPRRFFSTNRFRTERLGTGLDLADAIQALACTEICSHDPRSK